jgi:polar amino acid transport system substrate-binding protein
MYLRFAVSALVGFLVAACAAAPAPSPPREAARKALAPTGTLRVGLISVPVHSIRDPYSGNLRGVSHDLGRELAARLEVPFEPIVYPNPAAFLTAGQAGGWDVGSVGVLSERQALFDLAKPHVEIEFGYLVPAESRITTVSDVDGPGVRVAIVARATSDLILSRTLKRASIVRGVDLSELMHLLNDDFADVIAAQKTNLFNILPRISGSRVLEGSPGGEQQALAVPKGRDPAGVAYLQAFVEDAKRQGLVQRAIDDVAVRGVSVAR